MHAVRTEQQRVGYTNADRRVVLPYNYARTRIHGIDDKRLMSFLFVQSQ